ncbi:MAG: phosphomannose isomerase type II C-terminal cupin domain [Gammaproteobacteria bacterium]|jgi:mannose-6-phosphate isomerase
MNEISARPWGTYEVIMSSDSYKIKRIIVEPGQRLSLQSHEKRDEFWVVLNGNALVEIESHSYTLKYGESIQIKRNEKHRVKNISDDKLILIEVQTGEYFGEDDIQRFEDDYNRVK